MRRRLSQTIELFDAVLAVSLNEETRAAKKLPTILSFDVLPNGILCHAALAMFVCVCVCHGVHGCMRKMSKNALPANLSQRACREIQHRAVRVGRGGSIHALLQSHYRRVRSARHAADPRCSVALERERDRREEGGVE